MQQQHFPPVLIFLLVLVVGRQISAKSVHHHSSSSSSSSSSKEAEKSFQKQLGTSSSVRELPPPPQYMLSLYNSVVDAKAPNPYDAKVIRSFTEKDSIRGNHFTFNVSGMAVEETVLEAELHLYVLKNNGLQPHQIRVYQVINNSEGRTRLVDHRYVSGPMEGWQVFQVKAAVLDWMERDNFSSSGQLSFMVTAVTASSQPVPLRVSRRRDRHVNHQPLLVLFNDDDSSKESYVSASLTNDLFITTDSTTESSSVRQRRDLSSSTKRAVHHNHHHQQQMNALECHREELYVDFESIGWSEWIIAPKGYNAYHCSGGCGFPLGQSQRPTNHATVQSIVHEMRLAGEGSTVGQPCCVPNRLLSLSLLFYDEFDNVILKQFEEMVADSCGCH